jgi:hypothetical protein
VDHDVCMRLKCLEKDIRVKHIDSFVVLTNIRLVRRYVRVPVGTGDESIKALVNPIVVWRARAPDADIDVSSSIYYLSFVKSAKACGAFSPSRTYGVAHFSHFE